MSLDLDNVVAQKKKDDDQKALIAALAELSRSCPQYYYKQFDAYIADDLPSTIQRAFNSNSNIIGKLQNEGRLHGYISVLIDLKNKEEAHDFKGKKILAEIRTDVLDTVLRKSEPRTEAELVTSFHPTFTTANSSSSFFKKTAVSSNVKYGALAFGSVLGGVGLFTTLGLLVKSSAAISTAVAVMKVAAVATAATSGFPPAAIAMLVIGGTALLIAGIGLAAIAIQHYHFRKDSGLDSKTLQV